MRATRMTFFRVARGAAVPVPRIRPGVADVSAFLAAHVTGLQDRAAEGSASNASFVDAADEQQIERLRTGDDAAFLAAAGALGGRLIAEMAPLGGALPGLFVCATLESDAGAPHAAVLKLQVVSEQGAVLKRLDTGEETLAAVTDVLDRPGELQKGLVYPDVRPTSQAVVGDKAAQQEAKYFLRAVGVTLEARDSATAGAVVAAVARLAGRDVADRVAHALPGVEPGPPEEVLAAVRDEVPALTQETADAVAADVRGGDRPVVRVDTAAPVQAKLRAGALTVTGPADAVRGVTWVPDANGGWRVAFRTEQEPRITWR